MLTTLISFVVLLLILVFVHELGHFLAAKLLGVRVERFSLGFPPKIWSRRIGETDYQICWVPLGGYVSLLGEQPGSEIPPEDRHRALNNKPVWVKLVVVAAGPLFNVLFAVAAYWLLLWIVGFQHVAPVVGPISGESPAAVAGIRSGDVIVSVDGREVRYFDEIGELVEAAGAREVEIAVDRGGRRLSFSAASVVKSDVTLLGDPTTYRTLGLTPRTRPLIGQVLEGKPGEAAGLEPGDLVLSINGVAVSDWQELIELVQGPKDQRNVEVPPPPVPLSIVIDRGGEIMTLSAVPEAEGRQGLDGRTLYTNMLGVAVRPDLISEPVGLLRAFGAGLEETWGAVKLTVLSVYKIVSSKISAKVMGGPIMIAEAAGSKIRSGLADFVSLMALISVNLAVINLVPLPILDGGQIVIFLIEGVRRKPLSMRIREVSQMVGVGCLVALMALVFYNDISRIVTKFTGPPSATETTAE